MNSHATIGAYMTPSPHTIGARQSLATAHRLMTAHNIRHLPVLDRGQLVGIVSDRDLRFVESIKGVDRDTVAVEEGMTADPFTATRETPLREVVEAMAAHKYGAVVVMDGSLAIGIFTTHDVARLLAMILAQATEPTG